MRPDDVVNYCLSNLDGVIQTISWGERGIFYNPSSVLKRGVYVLTVKEKDGAHDHSSRLDRDHVYRINVGVRKETFIRLFGAPPPRPAAGKTVQMDIDFTALDKTMPHPVYAWMGWICVLNPSEKTFADWKSFIQESLDLAKEKYAKRLRAISQK